MRYQWGIQVKCWPISIAISLDSGEHCRRDRPALFTKPRYEAIIPDFGIRASKSYPVFACSHVIISKKTRRHAGGLLGIEFSTNSISSSYEKWNTPGDLLLTGPKIDYLCIYHHVLLPSPSIISLNLYIL